MNWKKLLGQALVAGVALKAISDVDAWLDDQINTIKAGKQASAYVEMAYEIAKMDNNQWQYLIGHLKVKSLRNDYADHVYQYCNYVVGLENNSIKELMSYSIQDAVDVLSYNVRGMKTYELAAHYGILKAQSEKSMKARAILGQFDQLLLG